MQRRMFWLGLVTISLVCGFLLPLVSGFVIATVAGIAWWWFVFRSGYF